MMQNKGRPYRVLFLEAQLDIEDDTSPRTQIDFMRQFLSGWGDVELTAKQVHSRADVKYFLGKATQGYYHVIHFAGHGSGTKRTAVLALTNEDVIDLHKDDDIELFRDLFSHGKGAIILSCCRVGRSEDLMQSLLEVSGAENALSYTGTIDDRLPFLIEPLFYHLYLTNYGRSRGKRLSGEEFQQHFLETVGQLFTDEPDMHKLIAVDA